MSDPTQIETHAYSPGDRVIVYNRTIRGTAFTEGKAVVRACLDADDTYLVEFDAEPGDTYERTVGPGQAALAGDNPPEAA